MGSLQKHAQPSLRRTAKRLSRIAAFTLFVGVVPAVYSCSGPEERVLLTQPLSLTARQLRGEHIFYRNCYQCHPGGDGGVGMSLNVAPPPDAFIRLKIRHGLGAMPAFTESELSDSAIDAVIDYLHVLRDRPAQPTGDPVVLPDESASRPDERIRYSR